jgi:hypothetical protein
MNFGNNTCPPQSKTWSPLSGSLVGATTTRLSSINIDRRDISAHHKKFVRSVGMNRIMDCGNLLPL